MSCRTLPSLPGIALQVLELTRDPRVQMDKISKLVQNDPALTAKILRTVNSSYYGLTNPCPTISRAVALLGLNTVKSLVLGFSLVEMTGGRERSGFDLAAYWRRTIYSAAAARLIARLTRSCDPEEAFVAALLQDVGMLAAHAGIGARYGEVLGAAAGDHDDLPAAETAAFGFDHAQAGALLAERWKLHPQIVGSIRSHHTPDSAAPDVRTLVRLVALGGDAAAVLTPPGVQTHLTRFSTRLSAWFGIDRDEGEPLIRDVAEGAAQLSKLMEIKTGAKPDVTRLLAEANEQLAMHQIEVTRAASALEADNRKLARQATIDSLTGLFNRAHFESEFARLSDAAAGPLAVLMCDVDRFKVVNDTHGHPAGDAVLKEVAWRIGSAVGGSGTAFRYGGEEFVVLLPNSGTARAAAVAEAIRFAVQSTPVDIRALDANAGAIRITLSLGVASADRPVAGAGLLKAADDALYAAKHAGRNRVVKADAEAPAAGGPRERTVGVLLVEDDPLAAKLIELMFSKNTGIRFTTAASGEAAISLLAAVSSAPPSIVLCDLQLPGRQGVDVIRHIRSDPRLSHIPVIAMSASSHPDDMNASLAAGANLFATKTDVCADVGGWVRRILDLAALPRSKAA